LWQKSKLDFLTQNKEMEPRGSIIALINFSFDIPVWISGEGKSPIVGHTSCDRTTLEKGPSSGSTWAILDEVRT
jgi:hypothetical protein